MAETRYHELLGVHEETEEPDYYQLLGIERSRIENADLEARFKEQMGRLQRIESTRHKDFIEFLKGELKRARNILGDAGRRREYDEELAAERKDELRKILSHMLVDGTLSSQAELSVIAEGRNLHLEGDSIRSVVDEELGKAGARRISLKESRGGDQKTSDRRAQEFARELQDARLDVRVANARAQMAERHQKKAEDEVQIAQIKVQRAQELVRRAVNRESKAHAQEVGAERERRDLETRLSTADRRAKQFEQEANRAAVRIDELTKENEVLRGQLADQKKKIGWRRLALAYACLFVAYMAGDLLGQHAPEATAPLVKAVAPHLEAAPVSAPVIPFAATGILLLVTHLLAGTRGPFYLAPLLGACAGAFLIPLLP